MSLSVQGLRVFLSILECGSLSAAGRELGMTQPAVSNHLHALEERFGVKLLTRGRPLQATPAGVCLAGHARRVVAELDALEMDMALQATPRGRLLVGASSTPGELLLPGIAVKFSTLYPDVALDIHIADTDETIAALVHRDIEIAVVGSEVDDPHLAGIVIEQDELVPVVAASDRIAEARVDLADLADRPFVLRERGSATRRAVEEGLAAAGLGPRVAMELGSNAAIAGAVAAGAGVGVVPARTVASQPRIEPIKVRGLVFSRPFVLVTERGRPLSPAAEAFAATCIGEGNA
jgi:DNA-binding transcriptional LysR family regulator